MRPASPTVKEWFIDKYGPNNAVLVLAGDITPAEAQPLVEKYFGAIKQGPVNVPAAADVPTLAAPKSIVMKDRVAAVQIQRHWAVPGLLSNQLAALDIGGSILGGLASSRLDKILVRDEKLAVGVSAGLQPFQRIGMFEVDATVKPGVDPAVVEKRLDEIIAEFIANGPTEEEVRRAATQRSRRPDPRSRDRSAASAARPSRWPRARSTRAIPTSTRRRSTNMPRLTPADVKAAMQQWLTRPAFTIRLEPGDRPPYEEAKFKPKKGKSADIKTPKVSRELPGIGSTPPLDFPDVQHAALSNGIKVAYAQRTTVPVTQVALAFDAGFSADAPNARGLQNLTLSLLDEGADGMTSQQIAEEQERLGAQIGSGRRSRSERCQPVGAERQPRPVARPARGHRRAAGLRPGGDRARPHADADRDRAGAEGPRAAWPHARFPALLYGENHPYATTALGQSRGGQGVHPRRSGRLPAALAAARQCRDLRRFQPAARGGAAAARAEVRNLGGAERRQGREELRRRRRPAPRRNGSC